MARARFGLILALLVAAVLACSGSAAPSKPAGCTPGAQSACPCVGGGEGVQVCNTAGTAFGPCMGCSGSSSSSSSASSSTSSSASATSSGGVGGSGSGGSGAGGGAACAMSCQGAISPACAPLCPNADTLAANAYEALSMCAALMCTLDCPLPVCITGSCASCLQMNCGVAYGGCMNH